MKKKIYAAPVAEIVKVCGKTDILVDPDPFYNSARGVNEAGDTEFYQDHMETNPTGGTTDDDGYTIVGDAKLHNIWSSWDE